jgi:ATP-dependent RNA helicase RhlB
MSEGHLSDLTFEDLDLDDRVLAGIRTAGFSRCTPIQAQTLPLALAGRDVAGQAQTGTGKTAAFLLAIFNRLLTQPPLPSSKAGPRALILAPTRELAVQIHADAQVLVGTTGFRLGLAFGGTDYEGQRKTIQDGVDILIGTPGRIIDYFKQGVFSLNPTQIMVLDEADRMFDLGFINDIRYVLRRLPPPGKRLNLLFSATLSHRVLELAYEHMNDPQLVRIEPDKITVDTVTQIIYFPSNTEKIPLLMGLLAKMEVSRTMVFVNTRRGADRLERYLVHNGIQAKAISGDVPQNKRLRMMKQFQSGELAVLIGTDVASRGLHIPDVSHVFNYDLPQDAEDYVHRIGRTARAGASGDAVSFGCEDFAVHLPEIEEYVGHRIPVGTVTPDLLVPVKRPPPAPRRTTDQRHKRSGGKPRGGGGGGRRRNTPRTA